MNVPVVMHGCQYTRTINDELPVPGDYESDFQKHFQTHYAASGFAYDELAPSYRFGFQMANDPKFEGRNFHDVEHDIKAAYLKAYPESDWDRIWDALFFGWEKAGGAAGGFGFI